jgi:aerobic-type carbon monoxide dehydrogenase small subunit (CoxS/CutS family)
MEDVNLCASVPNILESFDFEKVHKVMTFLDWRWADHNRVPTVEELKSAAYELMHESIRLFAENGRPQSGMCVSTGGFSANVVVFSSGHTRLQLLFYVDQAYIV